MFCIPLCEVALLNSTVLVVNGNPATGGEPPCPLIGPPPNQQHLTFSQQQVQSQKTATRNRTVTTNHSSSLSPNTRPTIHPQLREGIFTRVIVVALASGRDDTIRGNKVKSWSCEARSCDRGWVYVPVVYSIEIAREWIREGEADWTSSNPSTRGRFCRLGMLIPRDDSSTRPQTHDTTIYKHYTTYTLLRYSTRLTTAGSEPRWSFAWNGARRSTRARWRALIRTWTCCCGIRRSLSMGRIPGHWDWCWSGVFSSFVYMCTSHVYMCEMTNGADVTTFCGWAQQTGWRWRNWGWNRKKRHNDF